MNAMTNYELKDYLPELELIWDALVRRDDLPHRADAIVVGGCKDLGLAERAAELYHDGVSGLIVVSGHKPEGLAVTEAQLLSQKCLELGVPSSAILLEEQATNTGQNITLSAAMIKDRLVEVRDIVLVHMPFTTLRFLATAEAQWPAPQPKFYTACQSISFENYCKENGLEATAWEMLGDFKRMDEYVTQGYQTRQNIPESAKDAFEKIMGSGVKIR